MTFEAHSLELASGLLAVCAERGLRLATAESCTGGLLIACLTEIPGASAVVERGYVTYDDRAKREVLGVPAELLARHGAVSEEVARAMAEGVIRATAVDLALAVTGIAGPGGGTANKPVGLVHVAARHAGAAMLHQRLLLTGDRSAIRLATVDVALRLAATVLEAT